MSVKMFALSVLAAAALTVLASEALAAGAYQIDESHSGAVNFQNGFAPPLKRRWVRDLGGQVSYPLVVNGLVIVTAGQDPGFTGMLFALNARSGQTVWSKPMATYWSNAVYDGSSIFVIDGNGLLQSFSADSAGRLLWQKQMQNTQVPPLASGGVLYISDGQMVRALRETDGSQLWAQQLSPTSVGSPTALGAGRLYYTETGEYLSLDLATGKVIWDDLLGGLNSGWMPVYHDGRLYVRDPFRSAVVLDAATGAVLSSLGAYRQPPAFYDDPGGAQIEFTLFDSALYAVDAPSGNVIWRFAGDKQLSSAPLVIDGMVVEGSLSGRLYLLDGQTGKVVWGRNVGAPIGQQFSSAPLTGLGAGDGNLVIVAGTQLSLYIAKGRSRDLSALR